MFAIEKMAPCMREPHDHEWQIFARIIISARFSNEKFFSTWASSNITPVLFKPVQHKHPSRYNEDEYREIIDEHRSWAQALVNQGITSIVLAIDNDGFFHQAISPRHSTRSVLERAQPLFDLYDAITAVIPDIKVLLNVEDLSAGGLDAYDGILIAQAFEQRGLKEIIACSGSREFMPLFNRRQTRKKNDQAEDFYSAEPQLAAGLWLKEHTKLKVQVIASFSDREMATSLAKELGFSGVIDRVYED